MTTAHRPTWNSAKGGSEQGGNLLVQPSRAYSSKDLPAHQTLKSRQIGQGSTNEQAKVDFKQDLIRRELKGKRGADEFEDNFFKAPLPKRQKIEGASDQTYQTAHLRPKHEFIDTPFAQDKDLDLAGLEHEDDSSQVGSQKSEQVSEEESSDQDSDELELMREYAKIKKEREIEQQKKEQEKIEQLKKRQQEEIASSNPLLTSQIGTNSEFDDVHSNAYSLKRRWHEETVFKNQAKNLPKMQKRFINDTVRSDFHRKFMSKYIQ